VLGHGGARCSTSGRCANLGYIHWINDVNAILLREQGFLDGSEYRTSTSSPRGPASPKGSNSGFSDPNNSESYTEAFLQAHKNVNVIFARGKTRPAWASRPPSRPCTCRAGVGRDHGLAEGGAVSLRQNGLIKVDMARTSTTAAG